MMMIQMGEKVYLEAENFGLGKMKRFAVYFHETFTSLQQRMSAGLSIICYSVREGYLAMCHSGC